MGNNTNVLFIREGILLSRSFRFEPDQDLTISDWAKHACHSMDSHRSSVEWRDIQRQVYEEVETFLYAQDHLDEGVEWVITCNFLDLRLRAPLVSGKFTRPHSVHLSAPEGLYLR